MYMYIRICIYVHTIVIYYVNSGKERYDLHSGVRWAHLLHGRESKVLGRQHIHRAVVEYGHADGASRAARGERVDIFSQSLVVRSYFMTQETNKQTKKNNNIVQ